ncbi:ATP-dependent DNA ligase [Sphingobacterium sp. Mn56C]|uniref:ATP-dependent DNA ligase n=1 Tax=Sphingobacterium sp. Mn56C TaxID=3395261 RepID=UPI003BE39ED2
MKEFAALIYALDSTNKTNQKLKAMDDFFQVASDSDKVWFLALFTGKRPKRAVHTNLMKDWVMEITGIPDWLFQECYASVGDLGETISLLLPNPTFSIDKTLSEWMAEILALQQVSDQQKKAYVTASWRGLAHQQRFIFNKLLGGSFRVGVSRKGLINAIANHYQLEASDVAHSIMGDWKVDEVSFDDLIHGKYADTSLSKPYPFCLAYPLEDVSKTIMPLQEWQVELKWDGIRGQVIKRANEVFIWSRGEELVTDQFPEIVADILNWDGDFVLDGEILPVDGAAVLDFSVLQKRLNRKVLSKKLLQEVRVSMLLYDILELNGRDLRKEPLAYRRDTLAHLYGRQQDTALLLSPLIVVDTIEELAAQREQSRQNNSEGLMLKKKDSVYHVGRKKGDWWKWKIDPMTLDAVLIYAQKGSGRRSNYYTDYTFAVRDGDRLVTIAKAYSGLTDKEIQEVSRFVTKNAIEKFGPVRTVKPELVFELAFEGIGWSTRHKAGIALRFPRILRWRRDKTVADIDDLDGIKRLIK